MAGVARQGRDEYIDACGHGALAPRCPSLRDATPAEWLPMLAVLIALLLHALLSASWT